MRLNLKPWLFFIFLSIISNQSIAVGYGTNNPILRTELKTSNQLEKDYIGIIYQNKITALTASKSIALKTIDFAYRLIGIPYKRGGTNKKGFDCSGLVNYVYKKANISLPRTSAEIARQTKTIKKQNLRPGDLVFFNTLGRRYSHVGIYYGNNKFIHSPRRGKTVRIEYMNKNYWIKRFTGARRVI